MVYETFYRERRTGDTIALTIDELRRIRDLDLARRTLVSLVHATSSCYSAYTGMRYGDLCRLEPRHFDDRRWSDSLRHRKERHPLHRANHTSTGRLS